jgi:hypothetical protein
LVLVDGPVVAPCCRFEVGEVRVVENQVPNLVCEPREPLLRSAGIK